MTQPTQNPSRCLLAAWGFLGLTAFAWGQTPAAPPPAAPAAPDETVTLDAFNVTAAATNGYVSSESTTGTRVATKIADLPFSVNVITEDFMHDFDFFDVTGTDMGYVSGVSGVDSQGNANIRGFTNTFSLWDGFYRLGLIDRDDIQRIEVIKGDNAAIYGQASPAGLINYVPKLPLDTEQEQLQYTIGSYDLKRVEGDANTPFSIGSWQMANRVDFAGLDRVGAGKYDWLHTRLFSDGFQVKPNDHSSLVFKLEWSKRTGDPVSGGQLYNYNSATGLYYGTLAPLSLARFDQDGPNAVANRELTSGVAVYENRFNDVWSVRVSGYTYWRHAYNFDTGISNEWDPNLQEVVGISTKPVTDTLNEDGGAGQADLLAHWWTLHHTVENKTLVTFDYSQNWRFRVQRQTPTTISYAGVENPAAPNFAFPDNSLFTIVTRNDKVRWDTDGIFVRDQATFFNGRLLTFEGLRFDNVEYNLNFGNQYNTKSPFALKTAGQVQHFYDDSLAPQIGFNFKVTPGFALYSSWSQSFFPNAQNAKLGNPPLGDQHGRGWDYGIKGTFLDNRLNFTLGGFYVNQTGLKTTIIDPVTGASDTVPQGTENSKGLEFDSSFQIMDNWMLLGGYGYANARITNNGNDLLAIGRRPQGIPVDNGYLATRYSFRSGWANGLSANFGLVYDGVSYPQTTASDINEVKLRIPEYYVAQAGIGYTFVTGDRLKLKHEVRFSVKNLFNRAYADVSGNLGDSRGYFISYTLKH